jgi:hypothetical protein
VKVHGGISFYKFEILKLIFFQITFHEKFKQCETSAIYAVFDGHAGFQAAHYCQ